MEEALRVILLANASVTSAVGTRVAWGSQPQGTAAPYVNLHRIGGAHSQTTDGPDGMIESRVQADCWGKTYGEAKAGARGIIAALNGYRDTTFRHIAVESERDDDDLTPPNPLYRSSIDLRIVHKA